MNPRSTPPDPSDIRIVRAHSKLTISIPEIRGLLSQLTSHPISFSAADFTKIISSKNCHLYLALDPSQNNRIIGMISIVRFKVPTGVHGRIEDLVVDQAFRGRDVGKRLMQAAIAAARDWGVTHLELTSNSQRVAANRLYQKLNFQSIDTNVYRFYF